MKINLKKLQLQPQTSQEFYREEKGHDKLLADLGGRFVELVQVNVVVENTGQVITGSGKVHAVLQLICSRCLNEIIYPVDTSFCVTIINGMYQSKFQGEDDFIIINIDDEVDLWPPVEEAIFLAIPLNPLCSEGCQGLCPVCGVNKNLEKCYCQVEDIDPRWEELKKLK